MNTNNKLRVKKSSLAAKRATARFKKSSLLAAAVAAVVSLAACSGGGGSDPSSAAPVTQSEASVQGAAVKGLLVAANATLYALDLSKSNLQGEVLDTGTINDDAEIVGLSIPASIEQTADYQERLFVLEIKGGTEVVTNASPVIGTQIAIISAERYSKDLPFYATPLTTMVAQLAAAKNASAPSANNTEFALTLAEAEEDVKRLFGLGLLDNVSLVGTSPWWVEGADQELALRYRTSIEVFAAVVDSIRGEIALTDSISNEELIQLFANDLIDGQIDAKNGEEDLSKLAGVSTLGALLSAPPNTLKIPGTDKLISDLADVLAEEIGMISPSVIVVDVPPVDLNEDGRRIVPGDDSDGDFVSDAFDTFPANPRENADTDGDCGEFDASDTSAGEKCGDNSDYHITDASISSVCDDGSTDQPNGVGPVLTNEQRSERGCSDSDNDGVNDIDDLFPINSSEWADFDGDCGSQVGVQQTETTGNGCGDNSDVNICYSVYSDGTIGPVPPGEIINDDDFNNIAQMDGFTLVIGGHPSAPGVAQMTAGQRAKVGNPALPQPISDSMTVSEYNLDFSDGANPSGTSKLISCAFLPSSVNGCDSLTVGEITNLVFIGNVDTSNLSSIAYQTTRTIAGANVVTTTTLTETSRVNSDQGCPGI